MTLEVVEWSEDIREGLATAKTVALRDWDKVTVCRRFIGFEFRIEFIHGSGL